MLLRPSVGVQPLFSHGATFVLWCSTLALVTLAIAFACRQLVKNCPSTQLMTHEVHEPELVGNSSGSPLSDVNMFFLCRPSVTACSRHYTRTDKTVMIISLLLDRL